MNFGLPEKDFQLILNIISKSKAEKAILFGSRATGNYKYNSDIDIALSGDLNIFEAQKIAEELEELPTPYKFDIILYKNIKNKNLLDNINKFGIIIYKLF